MTNNYYITTPIYYVNDAPHIGHAYTTIACDVIARFQRLNGKNVLFLTGTDEHGQKVQKSALKNHLSEQEFVDQMSNKFIDLTRKLNISNDDFIRTTQLRHKKTVEVLWNKLLEKKYIYLGEYEGWYSVRDEAFYDKSELTQDGLAPTGAPVEWVKEQSYFFALSKFQEPLLELYKKNPSFVNPESKYNEVVSFVKGGLLDLSISRTSFNWGISVPNDSKHVVYVWLDALTNYISALDYEQNAEKYHKFWPANAHIVGKDILRFHAVYWPAFLMAAGIELPKSIFAHGWWTNEGQKISKSIGNVIDPFELVDEFGLDAVRYFLMREITFGNDGNYARSSLINRNNTELANKIGNLMNRTFVLLFKNNGGFVPNLDSKEVEKIYQLPLLQMANKLALDICSLMDNFKISIALEKVIKLAEQANVYIDIEEPWKLSKTDKHSMFNVLYNLLETMRYIGIIMQAFIPHSAKIILDQLSIPCDQRLLQHLSMDYAIAPNLKLQEPMLIFNKLE